MKRLLLATTLLAIAAASFGQSPVGVPPSQDTAPPPVVQAALTRLGGTYVYDPLNRGRVTFAATYRTATLTDLFGRKGLDLDVDALAGATGANLTLGTALLLSKDVRFAVASNLKGTLALQLGPALLYGAGDGRARLGGVVGLGFRF